ncbi:MAG: TlpA family protein disulfide reductase [Ignavibacteriaceae bacterium]
MIRKLFLAIIFLTSFTIFGCNRNASSEDVKSEAPVQENEQYVPSSPTASKAPNFTLVDTQGKKVSLSDYAGKVVIVDFWATWCPPCRKGIPDLIDIQKRFKNKVAVIGISVDTDTKSNVVPFMKSIGINYPVVFANSEVVQSYGGIEAIPTSFIIDKKGNISNQHVGLTDKGVIVDEIKKLLSDKS